MKIMTAEGYRDGRTYRVRFVGLELLADTEFQGDAIIPKYKAYFEGEHGRLSHLYSIGMSTVGVNEATGEITRAPVLRPSMGLARLLTAIGADWDDVMRDPKKGGLDIQIIDAKQRRAYGDDWKLLPRLKDTGAEGFDPVMADVKVGGESLLGREVIVLVAFNKKSGLPGIGELLADPDAS